MGYQNFYASRLFTDIGAADAVIALETPPTATAGRLVLEARNATQREIIKYTGVAGNTITGVTRGQGGTTAKSHVKNSLIEMNATGEDLQDIIDAFNSFAAANNDWRNLVNVPNTVTALGNRSYQCQFNGVDLTNLLASGMRVRTTRTVAAPTKATLLNGTTQFFNRTAAINGMTFTDDFTVSGWVKPTGYAASVIASRYNGTSGWALFLEATGQLTLRGYNAGAANFSHITTYQSIPLNKWSHITLQLDMSAFTATPTTSYIMIDGVDVPVSVARAGTNPTALVQAGNLEIGSWNGGLLPFAGEVAQLAIFSAKITQATIRGYISQGLAGTETNLVSAYSFNNALTDLNVTNANNLTANGGAVATNADSPFGGQASGLISANLDYGIIQSAVFAGGNTTLIVQVPEGCTIPTSGGITTVAYSGLKAAYGIPVQKEKWRISTECNILDAITIGALNVWQVSNEKITLPIGSWTLKAQGAFSFESTVSGTRSGFLAIASSLPTALSSSTVVPGTMSLTRNVTLGQTVSYGWASGEYAVVNAAQTSYQVYGAVDAATGIENYNIRGNQGMFSITADNAYL